MAITGAWTVNSRFSVMRLNNGARYSFRVPGALTSYRWIAKKSLEYRGMETHIAETPVPGKAAQGATTLRKIQGNHSGSALLNWLGFLPFFFFCLLFELL